MKLIKDYRGVPNGAIYPVAYAPGDECPRELEASAAAQGCLDGEPQADMEAQPEATPKTGIIEKVVDAVKSAIAPSATDAATTD